MTRVAQEIDSTIWDDCRIVDEAISASASRFVAEQDNDRAATRPDESRIPPMRGPTIPNDVWRLANGYQPYIG